MKAKDNVHHRLRAIMGAHHDALVRVAARTEVLGSMVGIKVTDGEATDDFGITFFVRAKLAKGKMRSAERIPRQLKLKKLSVTTDVMVWPVMKEQSLANASIINDQRSQGTLSCFARSAGVTFGMSCAHCLSGLDRNPATPTPVSMYSPEMATYLPAGESLRAVYSPGPGLLNDFGYLDCGLFSVGDLVFAERAARSEPIPTIADLQTLIGKTLTARSSLRVAGIEDQRRRGTVIGVNVDALSERCDVVLLVEEPGTFQGDSGMLWTHDSKAAAIHARGEEMPPLVGSRLTTAMSAWRAASSLGVELAVG